MTFSDFLMRCAGGALTASLCLAAPTLAAEAGMQPGHGGNRQAQSRFDQMDKDKDGKVVLEEFRATFPNMSEQAFGMIDVNGSNAIERAEWFDFMEGHAKGRTPGTARTPRMNNIPGDPLIPPPDSNDLPLMRPPN